MPDRDTVRVNITPEVAAQAERELAMSYRWAHGIIAWLGVLAVLGGISFFLDPTQIRGGVLKGDLPGPWDELWSGAWIVGGLLLIAGVAKPWQLGELFGWCVFVPAIVVYAVAIIMAIDGVPPAAFFVLSLAAGGGTRIIYLIRYAPTVVKQNRTSVKLERRQSDTDDFPGADRREA